MAGLTVLIPCMVQCGFGLAAAIKEYRAYLASQTEKKNFGIINQVPNYYDDFEKNKELALKLATEFFAHNGYNFNLTNSRDPNTFELYFDKSLVRSTDWHIRSFI